MYLFDDLAPVETGCVGVAEVPLSPLVENKSIVGSYALKEVSSLCLWGWGISCAEGVCALANHLPG